MRCGLIPWQGGLTGRGRMECVMRRALIMTLAGVASLAAFSSAAVASDGCGDGWHRNDYGDCRPNGYSHRYYRGRDDAYLYDRDRDVVVAPDIGVFYPGRGYWDGDRYYMHRRWEDGDWHYW